MGGSVDLYDVKVVDGYVLRCDVVHDLNARLNLIYQIYGFYDAVPLCYVHTDALLELKEKCLDAIRIITYLRKMSLLSEKSLDSDSKALQYIVDEITEILGRREEHDS